MTNANNLHTIVEGPSPSSDPPDDEAPARRSWLRRWWWAAAIGVVTSMITAVVVGSLMIHVPYVIESPGNLYATGDRISISGATPFPTTDKIDLVTVSLDTRVTAFEKFLADHNGDDLVVPAKEVLGTQSPAQNDALNALLMSQSKDAAVLVALQKLGYDVHPTPTGAVVEETVPGAPAEGVLNVAETIIAIDGKPVTSADELHNVLSTYKPGDKVTLTLEGTDHAPRTVSLTLGESSQKPGVAFLGIAPTTRLVYPDLPIKVTVASGQIGGPSAGLAFTLGILDLLTPGDLTAGNEVAATGTIDVDGTVGPIGGIASKVTTVARQHVKYFLVPIDDADEAKAHAPKDLQIVPVHSLDEALNFLATIGGSGLPPVSSPPGP
jgi:PDZ domain-containing protein